MSCPKVSYVEGHILNVQKHINCAPKLLYYFLWALFSIIYARWEFNAVLETNLPQHTHEHIHNDENHHHL